MHLTRAAAKFTEPKPPPKSLICQASHRPGRVQEPPGRSDMPGPHAGTAGHSQPKPCASSRELNRCFEAEEKLQDTFMKMTLPSSVPPNNSFFMTRRRRRRQPRRQRALPPSEYFQSPVLSQGRLHPLPCSPPGKCKPSQGSPRTCNARSCSHSRWSRCMTHIVMLAQASSSPAEAYNLYLAASSQKGPSKKKSGSCKHQSGPSKRNAVSVGCRKHGGA